MPCILFLLPTICVSSLLSTVHSLRLLFTLTHLLLKENGCTPGFQSAMQKDGTQKSPASSHSLLLQTNSKSQREDFLQEGKTHTHTEEPRWAEEKTPGQQRSCSDYSDQVAQACGQPHSYSVLLCGVMHVPDHGEGGGKGNNPETVTKWLPPHFDASEWEATSQCTLWGLLNTWPLQVHRYKPTRGYTLETAFLTTASAAPWKEILESVKFLTWSPSLTV